MTRLRVIAAALLTGLAARLDPARPVARADGDGWRITAGGHTLYRIGPGPVSPARPWPRRPRPGDPAP